MGINCTLAGKSLANNSTSTGVLVSYTSASLSAINSLLVRGIMWLSANSILKGGAINSVIPFQINKKNGARSQIFSKLGVHVRHVKLWLGHAFKGHILYGFVFV